MCPVDPGQQSNVIPIPFDHAAYYLLAAVSPRQPAADFMTRAKVAGIRPCLYQRGVALALDFALEGIVCKYALIDNYFNTKRANADFKSYLRQQINSPIRRAVDLGIGNSAEVNCLQVADMVIGAVTHEYKEGQSEYRRIIDSALEVRFWPTKADDL